MDTDRPPLPLLFQFFSPNNNSNLNYHCSGGTKAKYSPMMMASATIMVAENPSVPSSAECVELRSRNSKTTYSNGDPWRNESPTTTQGSRTPLMDHVVKNGETLMQISLQYSVPVSEIKRVNNIVADQEIHGLPSIRIPITRAFLLRRQLMEEAEQRVREGQIVDLLGEENTSSGGRTAFGKRGNSGGSEIALGDIYSSNESLSGRAKQVIEGILDETDKNMAAVRQNLPSPTLEGGAFHFVDAGAPDNSSTNVWLIVAVVLVVFVLLPLALTFLEENGEMEEHHRQQP